MKRLLIHLICLLYTGYCMAQDIQSYSFVHVNSESGLSQSNVKCILQDSYGFIWFGTKNGLNRYDGETVVQFDCDDPAVNKSNHNISALFEDHNKTLWIGTDEGVYLYNPVKDAFKFVNLKTSKGIGMSNWVACISEDRHHNIWIVIPDQGIFRYQNNKLYHYSLIRPSKPDSPNHLCVCDNGEVWVCTWNTGLFRYDPAKDQFIQFTKDAHGRSLLGLETNTISQQGDHLIMAIQTGELKKYDFKRSILEDITLQTFRHTFVRNATAYGDEIWVGTYNGLYILNEKTGAVKHFTQDQFKTFGLSDNIIYSIYRDREGGIWLGTMFGGANYLVNRTFNFKKYLPEYQENSLPSKRIREMAEDSQGNLWIGTEDAGINILSLKDSRITRYTPSHPDHNAHVTLAISSYDGNVYCGLYKEGLEVITPQGNDIFYDYKQLGIEKSSIYAFYIDSKKNKWIGTDWGVLCAPGGSKNFTPVPELKNNWIFDIMEDKDGTIWFASMGKGVWKHNVKKNTFNHYTNDINNPNSLSSNSVSSIMQDRKGHIWLSTDRGGICRYNKETDTFTRFSIQEGLPDDVAYKILEDDYGYLWFGTNRGLVRLNPETKEIRVFTVKDGLCGNQFNYKSAVKGSDGNFYFGSIEGLVSFNPNIKETTGDSLPPIYITKLSIFNKEVTVHTPNSPLQQSILETDKIVLPYNQANISLNIALLSYTTSATNEYAYKLEPIDKQWINTGNNNQISYANLPPGKYVLHIRANSDINSRYSTRSLSIVICSPWWFSIWAIIAYIIFCICAVWLWFVWYRQYKNKQLAEKQKLFEIEKEKELYENKVSFFTEIAHEIRTPLTLINGPLEIIEEMNINDSKLTKNLKVIAQNTKRLLNLASQLLDFQKVGAQKIQLNYEVVNVSDLLKETISRFEPTYIHQNKELKVSHLEEHVLAKIDKEAITKILSNLLNNALKYGEHDIQVKLSRQTNNFQVSVTSDGAKITGTKTEQIFEAFFQLNNKTGKGQGVGIGLPLARSLALLHKGTLYLDTTQPQNTFVLTIPLNLDTSVAETEILEPADSPLNEKLLAEESPKGNVILIVEDEENILKFMKERLSEFFIVETAENGERALDVLHKEHVDLVISDIMMPIMNGIELCQAIKSDINLCHIPVIFLTAKNDINSKIKGLKVGAEAYIEKPFSFDFLKTQVISLLNNRQKEREAFSKRPFFPVKNMQMSKEDEEFMNKVIQVINENMQDETFNVERMAEALCLSRSSLLRKIKTLFNLSPIDFIRLIRLKKAAELIQEGKYRVGEICYMVGFNSHSYFSKLFYKQFGMTPKDFEKQITTIRDKSRSSKEIKIEDLLQENKTNP